MHAVRLVVPLVVPMLLLATVPSVLAQTIDPAAPVAAMPVMVQPLTDADLLGNEIRALTVNPFDLAALVRAGELALRIGDTTAAAAFFARADRIDPRNARVKAGEGSLLVVAERPGEALRRFAEAEALGGDVRAFAADRGLAYDLIGEQERAQRDYRLALKGGANDETQRRYALSLGISGRREPALAQIDVLLRRSDRGAWRARAFILALAGDQDAAERIATSMMPGGLAAGLQPFFAILPTLSPADRAFAVHFGEVRTTPERQADVRLVPPLAALGPDTTAPVAVASTGKPAGPTRDERRRERQRRRDGDRVEVAAVVPAAPVGAPMPTRAPTPTPMPTLTPAPSPVRTPALVPTPIPAPPVRVAIVPQPVPIRPVPSPAPVVPLVPAPPPIIVPVTPPQPVAEAAQRVVQPVPPRPGPAAGFAVVSAPPPAPTPAPVVAVTPPARAPSPVRSEDSILTSILSDLVVPASELSGTPAPAVPKPVARREPPPAPAPVAPAATDPTAADRILAEKKAADKKLADKKLADRKLADKKAADKKAAEAKAAAEAKKHDPKLLEPSRIWVQVAGGASEHDLAKEWKRVRGKAAAAFKGHTGWTTPLRATNRVLAGPFKSEDEAQAFVNTVAKDGIAGFVFTSEAGQKITKLPVK